MAAFTVSTNADSGAGSLRQAIIDANTAGGSNTITFSNNVGMIRLLSNLPLVATSVQLDAKGSTLDGGSQFRGFLVSGVATTSDGIPPAVTVGISNLSIQNVKAQGGSGGDGGGGGLGAGGAVFVGENADVTLTNVAVTNATAQGGAGAANTYADAGGGGGLSGNGGTNNGSPAVGGGGGGILFNGGNATNTQGGFSSGGGGGGGGITGAGTDGIKTSGGQGNGGNGGAGLGGIGGGGGGGSLSGGTGGQGGGTGAAAGSDSTGGGGGFGGGGGGSANVGGTGGFGAGGGGSNGNAAGMGGFGGGGGGGGGTGGFGGGGGAGFNGPAGAGGIGAGAGNSNAGAGGGGLAAGGAIFVVGQRTNASGTTISGGRLTVVGGSFANDGATASTGFKAGAAVGQDLFLMTGSTNTLAAQDTTTLTIARTIADDSAASLPSGGSYVAGTGAGGALTIGRTGDTGTVALSAANTYAGGTALNAGTLELGTQTSAGTGAITFGTGVQRLRLDASKSAALANTLATLGLGDTLDLGDLAYAAGATAIYAAGVGNNPGTLTVTSSGTAERFTLSNPGTTLFTATSDGATGTLVTAYALPTISGTVAGQTTANDAPISPFKQATVTDPNNGTDTLTVQLTSGGANSGATGTLTDGQYALTVGANGLYTLAAGSAATVTMELNALLFTPTMGAAGSSTTTGFTLTDTSSAAAAATATDSTTTVTDTVAAAPASTGGGTSSPTPTPVTPSPVTPTPVTPVPSPTTTPIPVAPGSGGVVGVTPADAVSISPAVTYADGVFNLSGVASSTAGVRSVEISAVVDGARQDLGAATVNPDGTFSFADAVGDQQSFFIATLTDAGGGQAMSADPGFNLTGGLGSNGTNGRQNSFDATGQVSSTLFRSNGARQVSVEASGQTVDLQPYDIVLNHGQGGTTFVFDPGDGIDVVRGFKVRGAEHDMVSLKGVDFNNSIANVLRNTGDVNGSATITDPKTGDAIVLTGVSTADLKRKDFTFHA